MRENANIMLLEEAELVEADIPALVALVWCILKFKILKL